MVSENAEGKNTRYLVPFLVLLAAYCVWILTLPLFPSLDGSLHLYYASVMGSLLSGSKDLLPVTTSFATSCRRTRCIIIS